MSYDGTPDFVYKVFDHVAHTLTEPYIYRQDRLLRLVPTFPSYVERLAPYRVEDSERLNQLLSIMMDNGKEGICLRQPYGGYKCGRSTLREHGLLKVKFMEDSEAIIHGFEEALENQNPKVVNELGLSHRGHSAKHMVPKGTVGKIIAMDMHSGQALKVGTGKGLNDALKLDMWQHQEKYLGRVFKYQYQKVGTKDSPRIPSFQGFRSEEDLG